jgi:hypothetical protein
MAHNFNDDDHQDDTFDDVDADDEIDDKVEDEGKLSDVDAEDVREQICNSGETGTIQQVQLSEAMITSLRGILLDIDPMRFQESVASKKTRQDPQSFFVKVVRGMLSRHPVLGKAEVRNSGTGLHALLWFDKPIEFTSDGDRQRWAAIVKAIQRLLPTDPDCPGITALTRPVGSINSKNGATVQRLKEGEPVTPEEVLGLFNEVRARPFRTVAGILFGGERISPCPVCGTNRLDVLDRSGVCYGGCGKLTIGQLYDFYLKPRRGKKGN